MTSSQFEPIVGGMRFNPGLQGVRGLAVLLVLLAHLGFSYSGVAPFANGGLMGVTLFFVLSGYLITRLLLAEDTVSFVRFYARRALRLLPALIAFLAGVALIWGPSADMIPALTFLANWRATAGGPMEHIGHLWTLGIEEQFYLIWPLALVAITPFLARRRRTIVAVLLLLALASTALRFGLWHGGASYERAYEGTDCRADALLLGCALAIWLDGRQVVVTTLVPLVSIALFAVVEQSVLWDPVTWGVALSAVASALLVLWASERAGAFLCSAPLQYLGRISYGLYLWQVPIIKALPDDKLLAAVLSLAAGTASYFLVEAPFLRLKRGRLRPVAVPTNA